jgi:hypothetical protein
MGFEFSCAGFPAAGRGFVIPAKAGIQKTWLDSSVSSTGQAESSTNDAAAKRGYPAAGKVLYELLEHH